MELLVNNQVTLIAIQSKSISLEQICYKRSQGIAVTSLHCFLFVDVKKQRPKTNLEKCYHVVLALKLLWTTKIVFS